MSQVKNNPTVITSYFNEARIIKYWFLQSYLEELIHLVVYIHRYTIVSFINLPAEGHWKIIFSNDYEHDVTQQATIINPRLFLHNFIDLLSESWWLLYYELFWEIVIKKNLRGFSHCLLMSDNIDNNLLTRMPDLNKLAYKKGKVVTQ